MNWKAEPGNKAPYRNQCANEEVMRRHEDRDAEEHENSVGQGEGSVGEKPKPLSIDGGWRTALDAKGEAIDQPGPILRRSRAEVGDLDQIGQDIVAVKAQERIDVE